MYDNFKEYLKKTSSPRKVDEQVEEKKMEELKKPSPKPQNVQIEEDEEYEEDNSLMSESTQIMSTLNKKIETVFYKFGMYGLEKIDEAIIVAIQDLLNPKEKVRTVIKEVKTPVQPQPENHKVVLLKKRKLEEMRRIQNKPKPAPVAQKPKEQPIDENKNLDFIAAIIDTDGNSYNPNVNEAVQQPTEAPETAKVEEATNTPKKSKKTKEKPVAENTENIIDQII